MKRSSVLALTLHASFASLVACGGADDPVTLGDGDDGGGGTTSDGGAADVGGDASVVDGAVPDASNDGAVDAMALADAMIDASSGGDSGVVDAMIDASNCVGSVDVAVDNGPLERWAFECAGELYAGQLATPLGYLYRINGADPHGLKIVACKTAAQNSEGLAFYANDAVGVGTYVDGTPKFSDGNGMVLGKNTDPFNMVVTAFGAQGEPIDGTFAVTSTKNNVSHTLSGSFHVCRMPDYTGP